MRKVAAPKDERTIKGVFSKAELQMLLTAAGNDRDKMRREA